MPLPSTSATTRFDARAKVAAASSASLFFACSRLALSPAVTVVLCELPVVKTRPASEVAAHLGLFFSASALAAASSAAALSAAALAAASSAAALAAVSSVAGGGAASGAG